MDVAPPILTENSGISLSRMLLIFFLFVKPGSHLSFSARGACWPGAADSFHRVIRRPERLVERADDPLFVVRREVFRVECLPGARVAEELCSARGKKRQVQQAFVMGQMGEQLLFELWPGASGNHRHPAGAACFRPECHPDRKQSASSLFHCPRREVSLSSGGARLRLRQLVSRQQRQVIAQDIDRDGRHTEDHGDPDTPIAMRAFPPGTILMMNRVGFRPSVAVVTVLRLIRQFHAFSVCNDAGAALLFGAVRFRLRISGKSSPLPMCRLCCKKYGHPLDWMPILIHTPLREKEDSCWASRSQ